MRREGRREEGRRERKGNKETREEVAEERTRVEDGENREGDEGTEVCVCSVPIPFAYMCV